MHRFRPSLAVLAAIACGVPVARAEPAALALSVSRSPAAQVCPDERELRVAIERVARRPLRDGPGSAPVGVRAEVDFDRREEGFRAVVRVGGAKVGERELTDTGPSCAPLAQAVAITLVLLADHDPEADVVAAPPPPPEQPAQRSASWRAARAALTGGAALGLVGPASLDVSVGLSAERASGWGMAADVFLVAPRRTSLPPGEVQVWLLAAQAQLCRAAEGGRGILLFVCAGGAVGWLAGHGFGYPTERSTGFFWFAANARVGLGGPIAGRLRWTLLADLLVPLRRQTLSVDNLGVAWESRPVGGRVALGAEVVLW